MLRPLPNNNRNGTQAFQHLLRCWKQADVWAVVLQSSGGLERKKEIKKEIILVEIHGDTSHMEHTLLHGQEEEDEEKEE